MRVSRFLTSRRLFLLLGSIIVVIIVAGLTIRNQGRATSWPERVVMDSENTVSGWFYRPISSVTAFFGGIESLQNMYAENAVLKTEMQNYEALKAQLQDAQSQNAQLSTMLGYKQTSGKNFKLVPSHVVGRDPSLWNSALTIDVGLADGVKQDMAVVSEDGSLVGRIDDVGEYSSKVVLITDTQLGDGVSALVQNGTPQQPFGIILGSTSIPGQLDMTFWAPLVQIAPGNTVVTSGLSSIYPKGIVIGTVTKVSEGAQGNAQSAVVQPAADLNYLQNVFVVVQTVGSHS